jgi:uncharacterized surface protein with fasciclin (FAS1) repeats
MKQRTVVLSWIVILVFAAAALSAPVAAQDQTIADIVVSSIPNEFNTLLAALQAADPALLEIVADPNLNLTVFAPTDEAFAITLEALGVAPEDLLANRDLLTDILQYHIYSGVFDANTLITAAQRAPRNGVTLRSIGLISDINGPVFFPDPSRVRLLEGDLFINRARIVQTDIFATNGVVHVIDRVLLPPQH